MPDIDVSTTARYTVELPDYRPENIVSTQYGMRYPDGTIQWGADINGTTFQRLHEKVPSALTNWDSLLRRRADAARVDFEEYYAGHQLIKRHIIWAVTGAEDAS